MKLKTNSLARLQEKIMKLALTLKVHIKFLQEKIEELFNFCSNITK